MSKAKPKNIHIKRFADGKETPAEMHQRIAWGGRRCDVCPGAAVVRCISFAPFAEISQRSPELIMQLAAQNDGNVPMVEFTYGKFVRIANAFACGACKKDLAKAAAKAPSWVLIEFRELPKMNTQVQVAENVNG